MKKTKTKAAQVHAGTGHTCGQCAHGRWNLDCRDYQGRPFLIYCEHATYAYSPREKCNTCYGDHQACAHFIQGEKKTKGGQL